MLTLTYRAQTTIPIEVEEILPAALRDKSVAEIERLPVFHGNRPEPLAEFFALAGDPSDERITFAGDLSGVHWIGAKMTRGVLRVEGSAGRHLGSELAGGEIHVSGSVGDWAGAEMRRGLIHIRGDAGDFIGSAYRGSARGMTGGTLLVGGNVGREIALSMRRGLIAVGGDTGDAPCLSMIAGTVLVGGTTGVRPAAGMRRGSLVVLGDAPPLLPTFRSTGLAQPGFLQLCFTSLKRRGFALPESCGAALYRMFTGDLLTVGKGEVLVRAT